MQLTCSRGIWRAFCALFIALACALSASAQGLTKVKMGYFPALVDTPVFVAQAEGIFQKNGLEVEMISFTTGPALMSALLSGSTQFSDGGGGLLTFPQVARGHNIRGIANFWSESFYTLIARSNIPTPNKDKPYPAPMLDLRGKRVGVTALGALTAAMVETMARDAGLKVGEDITIVAAGAVNTAISALENGSIDAYLSYQPINQLLDARNKGQYTVVLSPQQLPNLLRVNLFNHMVTTQEYIASNPRAVQAMCRSIREALQWIRMPANFDSTVAILEKALPGNPPGVIAAALKEAMPSMTAQPETMGRITAAAVNNANEQLLALKYIPQGVSFATYTYPECNN